MGSVMLSSSTSSQLMGFHRLLRPAPIFSFLKQSLSLPHQTTSLHPIPTNSPSLRAHPSIFPRSRTFSNNPVAFSSPQALLESPDDVDVDVDGEEIGSDDEEIAPSSEPRKLFPRGELPNLSVKEKKELASYAHSLGKKLKCQQVGKSGVTHNVVFALDETLESKELLKLKIHNSCPGGELEDIVKHLEEALGSVVVGQIGRTVILYRPSLTKMKAEEKKKQAQAAFMRKRQYAAKQSFQGKRQVPGPAANGRRGSSRI